jgi:hypothetical protein
MNITELNGLVNGSEKKNFGGADKPWVEGLFPKNSVEDSCSMALEG